MEADTHMHLFLLHTGSLVRKGTGGNCVRDGDGSRANRAAKREQRRQERREVEGENWS